MIHTRLRSVTSLGETLERIKGQGFGLEASRVTVADMWDCRPIVLFGAGPLGKMSLAHLRGLSKLPVAIIDNDRKRWGTAMDGVLIHEPAEVVKQYANTARFVVTIYNGSEARSQLLQMGCKFVSHFADLYFEHEAECLPFCGLAARPVILESWSEVVDAASVWHDEASVSEYLGQIAWRLRLPDCNLPEPDSASECYFPCNVFKFSDQEVLFDCGAFDGDSLRQYLANRRKGGHARVLAFEPDAASYARLSECVDALVAGGNLNIRCAPWAVAQQSGEIGFAPVGAVTSAATAGGGARVTAVAIDDIQEIPTLIKMDVEGFELQALQGAAGVLRRYRPVLAIALYHHASDLWKIPNYLKSLVPEYRFILRRYAEDCWESVLYAVPESRLHESLPQSQTDVVHT
jgi:FkbM family methyltransferase